MCKYILGGKIACNWSWFEVDRVLIPMNILILNQWVLSVLDLNTWTIKVYDSMASDGPHIEQLRNSLEVLSNLLPFIAEKVGMFDIRQRSCLKLDPIPVTILDDVSRQRNR